MSDREDLRQIRLASKIGEITGEERSLMQSLQAVEQEIAKHTQVEDPRSYGLPDLMFEQGTMADGWYRQQQDARLREFIEGSLWYSKDGVRKPVKLIPEALRFISDILYRRVQFAILWKPRGGGGSLAGAIAIWLTMVYRKKSWLDLGGSASQAKVVYEYVKSFWDCFPAMHQRLLKGSPLVTKTELVTGAELECVAASEKAVRGKHRSGTLLDESCQKDEGSGVIFEAGIQGALSEPDPTVVLMSTFHWPFGFFQEHWDEAAKLGFSRYKWSVFATMQACKRGLEHATREDPRALRFCRGQCPLTSRREVRSPQGELLETIYDECAGQARDSQGWATFEQVLKCKVMNGGGDTWKVEFCCERPRVRGHVYNPERIESACVKKIIPWYSAWGYSENGQKVDRSPVLTVGLDWGLGSMAVAFLAGLAGDGRTVFGKEAKVFEGESAQQIGEFLLRWQEREHRPLKICADAEETYGNQHLLLMGLDVEPIYFGKWKQWGVDNLNFWFDFGGLKLLEEGDMARVVIPQFKKLHRSAQTGKIRKVADHGPDAALAALIPFDFMSIAGSSLVGGVRQALESEVDEYEAGDTIDGGL